MAGHPTSSRPRAGVVTVSYYSQSELPGFLDSVPAASSAPLHVVVVDNAATNQSVEPTAREHGAEYLGMPANVGYGAAMNAGVASLPAGIDWVLLSNPDVVLDTGVIDGLIETAEKDPAIAAVGPAVLDGAGALYPSARNVPSLRTGIGHALFANLWDTNPWSAAYKNEVDRGAGTRDAGWLSGSCLLVRRSLFEEVGGFDDGYFMYFEDVDLGYRLGKLGYRNVYEPSVSVRHLGAHSTRTESRAMVMAHHASARRFLSKRYPGPLLLPLRMALAAGLAVRSRIVRDRIPR